jgi:adenine-specific DNA-methyltransferase
MTEIHRITAPTGAFWLNLGYIPVPELAKALPLSYLLWDKSPFKLVQEVVWNYGAGVAGRLMLSPRNEKYLWYVKSLEEYTFNLDDIRDPDVKYPNQKKNGKIRVNPLGKNPSDVWQIPKVTTGQDMTGQRASPERTAHPAQFPEAVIDRIIKACSNPGDLVLDPFLGSGTTVVVAQANGRNSVGFEIKPEYVAMSSQRIRERLETPQQPLLV